jgi:hypothetical protein
MEGKDMPEITRLASLPLPIRIRFSIDETKSIASGLSDAAVVAGVIPEAGVSKAIAVGAGLLGVIAKHAAKRGYAIEVYYLIGLIYTWRLYKPKPALT